MYGLSFLFKIPFQEYLGKNFEFFLRILFSVCRLNVYRSVHILRNLLKNSKLPACDGFSCPVFVKIVGVLSFIYLSFVED